MSRRAGHGEGRPISSVITHVDAALAAVGFMGAKLDVAQLDRRITHRRHRAVPTEFVDHEHRPFTRPALVHNVAWS